ncbi:hypothetical protein [Actinoplanes sp. HUAS TT8]|uniref:hypothetical protein n=1 Tax=Actinoplanes sp. HUAS TT8 TaxID=3447453 RepID=UPI003F51B7B5
MSRRIGTTFALATAAAGLATAAAAPALAAAPRGPEPVSSWLKPIRANVPTWVDIAWRTDRPVCDAQVQVRGERVRVEYLGNRRAAGFLTGRGLSPRRPDVTRIRVTTDYVPGGAAKLWATVSYNDCGLRARTQTRTTALTLPVVRSTPPGGQGGPGGPGTGHPGGPTNPGMPGHDQPGTPHQGGAHPGGSQPGGPGGQQPGGPGHGGPGQGSGHH